MTSNVPEDRRSHLLRVRSPKSHTPKSVPYRLQRYMQRKNKQNTLLRLHGNTFNVTYTDRDIRTSTVPREVLVAFPSQQWLRERATILRYYLSCIII